METFPNGQMKSFNDLFQLYIESITAGNRKPFCQTELYNFSVNTRRLLFEQKVKKEFESLNLIFAFFFKNNSAHPE